MRARPLSYHDRDPKRVDSTALWKEIHNRYLPYPARGRDVPAERRSRTSANPGYASAYYTYMWSLVIAKDLLTGFDVKNLSAPGAARRYRDADLRARKLQARGHAGPRLPRPAVHGHGVGGVAESRNTELTQFQGAGSMFHVRVSLVLSTLLVTLSAVLVSQSTGPDWPQFRGPNRDGAVASFVEPKVWPEKLTQRWKVDVGEGHATPVLVGGRVYVFTRQGANEVMQALDAGTGKAIWQTRYAGAGDE